ncbi:hypothetical protein NL676_013409 [Syzygium grande]|nr:hypothetical protein NL676_013409 [Syzygium grande]
MVVLVVMPAVDRPRRNSRLQQGSKVVAGLLDLVTVRHKDCEQRVSTIGSTLGKGRGLLRMLWEPANSKQTACELL